MAKVLAALVLVVLCIGAAGATPLLRFSLATLDFTTHGGTHLQAKGDEYGHLLSLRVTKKGRSCVIPKEILENIKDADLSSLEVYEDRAITILKIRSYRYEEETGNSLGYTLWSLHIWDGKFEKAEHDETLRKDSGD